MRKLLAAAFLAAMAGISATHAQENTDTRDIRVRYDDLNLGRRAGAKTFLYRVRNAAKLACGEAPDIRELERREAYNACVHTATNVAVAKVHAPLVAAAAAGTLPDTAD